MKFYDKLSVRIQFRFILTVLILCFSFLSSAAYLSIEQLYSEKNTSFAINTAEKYTYEMNYLYQRIDKIAKALQSNDNIYELLYKPFNSQTISRIEQVKADLIAYTSSNIDIIDIALVNDNIHWSSIFRASTLDQFREMIYDNSSTVSLGIVSNSMLLKESGPTLLFGSTMHSKTGGPDIGHMFLSVGIKDTAIYLPEDVDSSVYFILADKDFNTYPISIDQSASKKIETALLHNRTEFSVRSNQFNSTDTINYTFYYSYIPKADYYIIGAVDKVKLSKDLKGIKLLVLALVIILAIFLLIIIYMILNNLVVPINRLHQHIKSIRDGNRRMINTPIVLSGCTEIRNLSMEYTDMMKEISDLNHKLFGAVSNLYETKLQKQEADIAFLRSQINPHFLYNTLETIKGIALENHVPHIAEISNAMGLMFRYSIKGEDIVTLRQELEITAAYLRIQQARFVGKFEVIYNIPDELKNMQVIKMILQPVVENSIYHGLERKAYNGTLYIGAKTDGGHLVITIMDDGAGMDSEQLDQLQRSLSNCTPSTEHIGILNTQSRICLKYGKGYGMRIESSRADGTKVDIILPAIPAKQFSQNPERMN